MCRAAVCLLGEEWKWVLFLMIAHFLSFLRKSHLKADRCPSVAFLSTLGVLPSGFVSAGTVCSGQGSWGGRMDGWIDGWCGPYDSVNQLQMWGNREELFCGPCLVCSSSDGVKRDSKTFLRLDIWWVRVQQQNRNTQAEKQKAGFGFVEIIRQLVVKWEKRSEQTSQWVMVTKLTADAKYGQLDNLRLMCSWRWNLLLGSLILCIGYFWMIHTHTDISCDIETNQLWFSGFVDEKNGDSR